MNQGSYMEKLPLEVALEIFCRLPLESVVTCKLVCKSWLSLLFILDDDRNYFANMHLSRHLQRNLEYPTLNFIAFYEFRDQFEDGISAVGEFHITEYDVEKLSYKVKRINFFQKCISGWNIRTRLAGSCNGLLCLPRVYESPTSEKFASSFEEFASSSSSSKRKKERIGIYNPLLNEYVLLPLSDLQFKYCSMVDMVDMVDMVIGFGHNPLTDEYKVVRVYYSHSCYIGDVEVYTLGTSNGLWRSIGTIKYRLQGYSQPVLVNGLLHWLSQVQLNENRLPWSSHEQLNENRKVVGEHQQQIVSFNFEVEEFQVIPLPYSPPLAGLKELGGCLCLITQEIYGMDIWRLKDYMNKESWVKEFNINLGSGPGLYTPCAIKKKDGGHGDEILLWRDGKRLFTHYPKIRHIEEVEGRQVFDTELLFDDHPVLLINDSHKLLKAAGFELDPVLHINSLVSLKAAGEDTSYTGSNRKNKSIIKAKKRKKVMESP